jgi:hypothetical protein
MFLRSLKLFIAALFTLAALVACGGGGSAAPAATGLKVTPGEGSATVTWDMVPGVEYWLFYAPTANIPADSSATQKWIGLVGGGALINVSSPYVVSGLVNGTSYSFTINGRTDGGPGGPGAAPVAATPRIAGSTWTAGTPPTSKDLRSVTFGTTYVAAGTGGAMYSSADGATWNAINYTTGSNLNGASYLSTYKLVGDGGVVLTSPDAATWTAQTSGTTQNLYAIASNNVNLNVAVGANGTIIASIDGITWTPATNSATTNHLYGVTYTAYNSGTWVAVGAAGTIVESADGLTWHAVTSSTGADLRGIAYGISNTTTGATTFAAVGASGTVLSSTDGATWTPQVVTGASTLNAVAYGTQFVAVGTGGNIVISNDGVTWTAISPLATSNNLYAVARGTLAYSAVGAAGTNLLSK